MALENRPETPMPAATVPKNSTVAESGDDMMASGASMLMHSEGSSSCAALKHVANGVMMQRRASVSDDQ